MALWVLSLSTSYAGLPPWLVKPIQLPGTSNLSFAKKLLDWAKRADDTACNLEILELFFDKKDNFFDIVREISQYNFPKLKLLILYSLPYSSPEERASENSVLEKINTIRESEIERVESFRHETESLSNLNFNIPPSFKNQVNNNLYSGQIEFLCPFEQNKRISYKLEKPINTQEEWNSLSTFFKKCPKVERFFIERSPVKKDELSSLLYRVSHLSLLKSFHLQFASLDESAMIAMKTLLSLLPVETLNISECKLNSLPFTKFSKHLKYISISKTTIEGENIEKRSTELADFFTGLPTNLESLDLSDLDLSKYPLPAIRWPHLVALSLCGVTVENDSHSFFNDFPETLEYLFFSHTIEKKDICLLYRALNNGKGCHLKELHLPAMTIESVKPKIEGTEWGWEDIIKEFPITTPSLEVLDLSGRGISKFHIQDSMKYWQKLITINSCLFPHLREIDLSRNGLKKEDVCNLILFLRQNLKKNFPQFSTLFVLGNVGEGDIPWIKQQVEVNWKLDKADEAELVEVKFTHPIHSNSQMDSSSINIEISPKHHQAIKASQFREATKSTNPAGRIGPIKNFPGSLDCLYLDNSLVAMEKKDYLTVDRTISHSSVNMNCKTCFLPNNPFRSKKMPLPKEKIIPLNKIIYKKRVLEVQL